MSWWQYCSVGNIAKNLNHKNMKKGSFKKQHKSIRVTPSKFLCNFKNDEHVLFEEVTIRVKYRPKATQAPGKKGWLKILKPSFWLHFVKEIVNTMF